MTPPVPDATQPEENYAASVILGSLLGAIALPIATAAFVWFLYSVFGVQVHDDVSYAFALVTFLPVVGAILSAFTCCASVAASWEKFRKASGLCLTGGLLTLPFLLSICIGDKSSQDFADGMACLLLPSIWGLMLLFWCWRFRQRVSRSQN